MKTYTNIKDFMRFVMNEEQEITIKHNKAYDSNNEIIAAYETNTQAITESN
jgi:hypothetical protein